ncbi:lactonase family protein [Comamonas endophytica]|uniref:Lactonase family protein n=1 Tax=Comamonas endophytica TaxID=2949090 RepID=A0ABY6GER9_9BURK|nr:MULTISPECIES: beta-propeller fold lactonase family protein [unclassified Acidovorax]MCD2513294.1 lactonase family protein [Acidovorax sp. D4N7]UYG53363.1 lactonase family protein [Acidovorax sp. 5MLIR]
MKHIALIVAAACSLAAQAGTFAYVSNAEDGTISSYRIDRAQGRLQPLATTEAGPLVMPLAQSPDGRHLYASLYAQPHAVVSYRIDGTSGALDRVATTGLPQNMPHIATDRSGRYLLAASYDGDQISVSPIGPGGVVQGEPLELHKTGRHAHSIVVDPSNRFAYVALLGADRVLQLAFDERNGALTPIGTGFVQAEQGTGPRHIAPAPNGRFLYVLNELSGGVSTYAIDRGTGALRLLGSAANEPALLQQLPKGMIRAGGPVDDTPRIWAADIKVSPDGRFVYATERTTSTVSWYRANPLSGELIYSGYLQVEKQPRGIAIDPRGRWLVVTGEKSPEVGLYAIDFETGALRRADSAPAGKGANWVEIVDTD